MAADSGGEPVDAVVAVGHANGAGVVRYTWAIRATNPSAAPQGRTVDVALKSAGNTWTPLKLQASDGKGVQLPRMAAVANVSDPLTITVQPLSYSFNLLAGADAAACR
jgi:hypothetical protein